MFWSEPSVRRKLAATALFGLAVAGSLAEAQAQKKYGPGVTDTEILVGQTMPYSGPISMLGTMGKVVLLKIVHGGALQQVTHTVAGLGV